MFPCWNLGTSLGSWGSEGEPLAGPKCGRCDPVKRPLVFKHGHPTAGGCQIPTSEGQELHFKPSEVLGVSLCPVRDVEFLPGLMEEGDEAFLGQNIPRGVFQGAFCKPQPLVT